MIWDEIKSDLSLQMPKSEYNQWILPTQAEQRNGTLFILANNQRAYETLTLSRLHIIIKRVIEKHHISFEIIKLDELPPEPETTTDINGVYQHDYTTIVKPEKVEVFTQYFRKNWRPKLGPLLSELIRELRQQCYFGRGDDHKKRNMVEITYSDLATALGVHRNTIYNNLKRASDGRFISNEYLHLFITDVEILTRYDEKKRRVVIDKTRFTVALDEPIVPNSSNHNFCD